MAAASAGVTQVRWAELEGMAWSHPIWVWTENQMISLINQRI